MSNRWLNERKRDPYYRWAKEEGYRSRSAYKIEELNERFGFLNNAKRVLDLGAAPGGWLQVASELVDEDGLIVGVDLENIRPLGLPNVKTIIGDVTKEETQRKIFELFDGKIDVILSDMAPDITGDWGLDQYRQIYLARIALVLADSLLREDGWLAVKTFQGSEHSKFVQEVRDMFIKVKIVKPKASRKKSAEIYIVAKNLKPNRKIPEDFRDKDDI
jgi:23S rRNA (uridine2552-2'-O)-methyltransferase